MSKEPYDLPPQVRQAVESFAPYSGFEWQWHPIPIDSNYNPIKTLSATLHTVEMATQSSPIQIALYRNGEYVAQGTPIAGAFVSIRHDDCTETAVALRIRIPGDQGFMSTKSIHYVKYHYHDGRIFWSGDWPIDDGLPVPGFAELEGS